MKPRVLVFGFFVNIVANWRPIDTIFSQHVDLGPSFLKNI